MIVLKIVLILILMYIGLYLYFENRVEKSYKKYHDRLKNYESKTKSKEATK